MSVDVSAVGITRWHATMFFLFVTLGGDYRRQEGLPRRHGRHESVGLHLETRRDCVEDYRVYSPSGECLHFTLTVRGSI